MNRKTKRKTGRLLVSPLSLSRVSNPDNKDKSQSDQHESQEKKRNNHKRETSKHPCPPDNSERLENNRDTGQNNKNGKEFYLRLKNHFLSLSGRRL
jgi:hypothetical protein